MATSGTNNVVVRPMANFSPSLWGDRFYSYSIDHKVGKAYAEEIENLKEQTRAMLSSPDDLGSSYDTVEKLKFIDLLERLGISYHFEKEIEDHLHHISTIAHHQHHYNDLETVALQFRLLRQHGFHISSDIFNGFVGMDGKFKDTSNVSGLLSLYEASMVITRTDDNILGGAFDFANTRLRTAAAAATTTSTLDKLVAHALEQPLHTGMPRIETRFFISVYEANPSRNNDILLRFAKLDYNTLQMLHRQELSEISRWWQGLNFAKTLPYARDRAVECYFWALGVYFEPKYSKARVMLAKNICIVSILDDTYDAYGTIPELDVYTHAVSKWDISEIDHLPDYMKISYKALLDIFEEDEMKLSKEGRSFAVHHAKERMKELVSAYLIEAKWLSENQHKPPIAEYLRNGLISCTYYLLATISCYGLECADEQVFEWLMKNPKVLEASTMICRTIDDIATFDVEKERGQEVTGIECYMNEHGVALDVALETFNELAKCALKDLNQGILKPTPVPREILLRILNLSRIVYVTYQHNQDGYTHPEKVLKPHILALLLHPLPL
ncbi:unnamed protein product [Cuscuta campestris]|uniref:5-epiaristolochene synthase n=1 Tax=Cuscuta campestris TaxID=132261 RepID=A0A484M7V8_9ASTE|nr:unnamed protein product [Cuscuta campestris]